MIPNPFRVKKLYSFVLDGFFPLLAATFSVSLFIFLMLFLWTYVNDMVGKGVEIKVLAELFFYAALTFTSMALPLSVLLASLITFGNLGEHFELLAMKASGISLFKIMRPLIITVIFIVFISFYFQNNIQTKAQIKIYTILYSLRQKTPELNIPEGVFYKEIKDYNVYVRHKDKKNGLLLDMMIYDYSKGFENALVIVADTGRLHVSSDRKNMVLTLYSGKSFQNMGTRKTRSVRENVPYQRETFSLRTILIPFDTNLTMVDESVMGGRDVGKNIAELTAFIDSARYEIDSLNSRSVPFFKNRVYTNTFKQKIHSGQTSAQRNDTLFAGGFEAYFNRLSLEKQLDYAGKAKNKADNIQNEYMYSSMNQTNTNKTIKSHEIQLQKRFALSLACLLFFFIGAPLGAIIRKGGLGMPAVLSVFLFILYYTIDTFGLKMAKQGVWPVWEGMWLSTVVLAALGAFFTYKAVNDSVMMNPDSWKTIILNYSPVKNLLKRLKKGRNTN
ncbi:MAG: LptF/LptG family permease [Dysgonamonadaceae bacterium]|jgi:lipopolysaccharide export system permease protein|nr:LptF/LptG family permease [Dysgonamonadaceae bacterium]